AVVEGDAAVAQELLALPFDHIFFTGSPQVGKLVMEAAAKSLASVTLELGGKSPTIVGPTANLKKAARNIVWGKFANNGQTCIAPDYVYVHEDVRSAFAEAVDKALHKLYGAQERIANNADYCRMVNDRHYERVSAIIDDAKNRDATILRGGERDATERFIAPTVIGDVPADARLMQEEIFGPVLPILTYRDTDEVIAGINGRPKALALYLFARDKTVSERIIAETSAGGTSINTTLMHYMHGRLPFGGVNNSGIGSAHGHWGFKAFSHERAVLRNRFAPVFLFMPPYGRLTRLVARLATRFMS
ncbi:MAG TPA: aldehyde dehydrogenase family protein, partial [Salinisphaeraceae bacterium]|nr:aldehyde dehydrogenase family protein [Salinisphaeraceae bacterium]